MKDPEGLQELARLVEGAGLLRPGSDGVVMLSGGADSAAMGAAAVQLCGPRAVAAIHVNYGLREDSGEGEEAARRLSARLRIDLHIERPDLGSGNLQARAREARYAAAEALRQRLGADWIATGHTRTDLLETILYRLAVSPGSRALRTMQPRRGRVIRPLIGLERSDVRALARSSNLPFADDPSNSDPRFARNRIRAEVVPVLREIGPELERNVALTHAEWVAEGELLERLAADALGRAGAADGGSLALVELEAMDPALRRIALRQMAERAAGRSVALGVAEVARIERAMATSASRALEFGRGLRAICEVETVRFSTGESPPPTAVTLPVPGLVEFGEWEVSAELVSGRSGRGPDVALVDPELIGRRLEVRAWREGDRIRPLGMAGSKSLQDLFTDHKVPQSLRRRLPVIVSGERVVWVAGVALGNEFRHPGGDGRAVSITARALGPARSH